MQRTLQIKLLPAEAGDERTIREYAAQAIGCPFPSITGFHLLKRSIDARSRQPHIILTVHVFVDEPYHRIASHRLHFPDVSNAEKKVVIIGAGPAGLFAAFRLIENGIQPILLERGKDVKARRRDLAALNKEGIINADSNYCFGEGGAGTYSDGKLY